MQLNLNLRSLRHILKFFSNREYGHKNIVSVKHICDFLKYFLYTTTENILIFLLFGRFAPQELSCTFILFAFTFNLDRQFFSNYL